MLSASRLCHVAVATVALLIAVPQAFAEGPVVASPEQAGFSAAGLARIDAYLKNEIDGGKIPGAMMLIQEGKLQLGEPLSKYIPAFADVKVGVERKGEDGAMALDLVPPKGPITIQDLMRHTSGLTYGFFGEGLVKKAYVDAHLTEGDVDNAEFAERLAKLPLA